MTNRWLRKQELFGQADMSSFASPTVFLLLQAKYLERGWKQWSSGLFDGLIQSS
jgi:hypothetical protein